MNVVEVEAGGLQCIGGGDGSKKDGEGGIKWF